MLSPRKTLLITTIAPSWPIDMAERLPFGLAVVYSALVPPSSRPLKTLACSSECVYFDPIIFAGSDLILGSLFGRLWQHPVPALQPSTLDRDLPSSAPWTCYCSLQLPLESRCHCCDLVDLWYLSHWKQLGLENPISGSSSSIFPPVHLLVPGSRESVTWTL